MAFVECTRVCLRRSFATALAIRCTSASTSGPSERCDALFFAPLLPHCADAFQLHKDRNSKPGAFAVMAAGSVGGMAFWALYPLDMIKTKLQTDASLVSERFYKGYMHCARHTYQTVGMSGMMAGLAPCLIRAAVANAFCLLAYEQVLHMLHKDNSKNAVVIVS